MNMIDVMVFRPTQAWPDRMTIPNTLEAMQETVGGFIEVAHSMEGALTVVVNEEGCLKNLPHNFVLSWYLQRPIVGTGFICRTSEDGQDFRSITDMDWNLFAHPQVK